MGVTEELKRCRYCKTDKALSEFYRDRRGVRAFRCRDCHGLAIRVCIICGDHFIGRRGRKACSQACRRILRPATFRKCQQCGQTFGPLSHLSRKYCSQRCKIVAQTTGRKKFRVATQKARAAQRIIRYHLQAGHFIRPTTCESCGAEGRKIEAAHFDYDEPLRVRWLCRSCHVKWDKRQPKHGTVVVPRSDTLTQLAT